MSKAEERALEEYPPKFDAYCEYNATLRVGYKIGYEQAEKDMTAEARERVVKVDAGGYPYIDCNIELYDYDTDTPLANAGDKVKVIIIKE